MPSSLYLFMKKYILFTVAWLAFVNILSAQQNVITGKILSAEELIIGATVWNSTQTKGSITDQAGRFSIEANNGDKIVINYLGYSSYEFQISNELYYEINLIKTSLALNEVVITALGLKRSTKDLGYAIQKLDGKDVSEVKAVNFIDNLGGKLAGVTINQGASGVGSTSKVIIRGENSFSNNNPLFILDGIPISNATTLNITNEKAAGFQEVDFGNGAMDINPEDVASISVLKGPSAAALYGSRASNGVIVIESKDGSNQRGLGLEYSSSFFIDKAFKLPEFQNTYGQGNSGQFEFVDGLGGGINDNITYSYGPQLDIGLMIPQFDSPVTLANENVVRGGDVAVHGGASISPTAFISHPDNLKNFYQTGNTLINSLAINNASKKSSSRLSFSNLKSSSFIPGVNLNRNNISGRLSFTPTKKLKITSALNFINTQSDNRPASGYGSENINYSLVAWLGRQSNIASLKDYWQPGLVDLQQYSYNYTFFDNPYFILFENRNAFNRNRVIGKIQASYSFSDQLSLMIRTGLDNLSEERNFRRAYSSNRFNTGAYAEHDISFNEQNTDLLLNYKTSLGNVSIDLSAGANRLDQKGGTLQTQAIGLAQPGIYSLTNASAPLELFQFNYQKRVNSIYGLMKFHYKDFLHIDVTGRNDWSSAFAAPNNNANVSFFYPSVSSSLILSKLVELPELVSFAKLRASYAQVANDTDPYQTLGVFSSQTPVGGLPTFSEQNFIPNNNLLPEKSTALEFGFDIRILDDRIHLDLSYYNAKNENQILSLPIAASSGYNQQIVNGGVINSKGLELILAIQALKAKRLRWNTQFNFSTHKSIVKELPDQTGALTLAYSRVYDNPNQTVWFIVEEGDQIGDIWGTGYAKNENGDFIIAEDGKLIVDNRLKKLGNYNPDFIVGINNSFAYKNLSLNFNIDWRQGGAIVSRTQALAGVAGQLKETEHRPDEGLVFDGVINTGTESNPVYEPNTIAINPETYYRQFYDRNHEENNLHDASYLKLREFQLSYTFSKSDLKNSFLQKSEGLSISLIGRNLFVLSSIPHFDPEQLAVQGNTFVNGVEDMSYPSARSIGVSINLKL